MADRLGVGASTTSRRMGALAGWGHIEEGTDAAHRTVALLVVAPEGGSAARCIEGTATYSSRRSRSVEEKERETLAVLSARFGGELTDFVDEHCTSRG